MLITPSTLVLKPKRAFSLDVTAAMLVFQNKEMAAIMVYQTNPLFLCKYFHLFQAANMAAGHVSENALYSFEICSS